MKRFFSVALVFALLLSLTACGSSPNHGLSSDLNSNSDLNSGSDSNLGSANSESPGDPATKPVEPIDKIPNNLTGSGDDSDSTEPNDPGATGSEHNPEATGSDPEDFWLADDYFDLVGYINSLGCSSEPEYDWYTEPDENGKDVWRAYSCSFELNHWKVSFFYHNLGISLNRDGTGIGCATGRYVELGDKIVVDEDGSISYRYFIDNFIIGTQLLKNADTLDLFCPLCGASLDEMYQLGIEPIDEPFDHMHIA